MAELTDGGIPGLFQEQYDINKSGYPILQVSYPSKVLSQDS